MKDIGLIGAVLVAMTLLVIAPAIAFPLSNGNGIVNATVYGVTTEGSNYYVDMSIHPWSSFYRVELIDSEDRASGSLQFPAAGKSGVTYHGSERDTLEFNVPAIGPDKAIIKRLKVTPLDSDPFSIDWKGAPEVSANGIKLAFYSGKRTTESDAKYAWDFDLKITNLGQETLEVPAGIKSKFTDQGIQEEGFTLKDTGGWVYGSVVDSENEGDLAAQKLLPNESLRLNVHFEQVGAFSRPAEIAFDGVSMDIGAWV